MSYDPKPWPDAATGAVEHECPDRKEWDALIDVCERRYYQAERERDEARAQLAAKAAEVEELTKALAEANGYIRDYAHPRAEAMRSALEEIGRPKYDGRTCSTCDHDFAVEHPLCPGAVARAALATPDAPGTDSRATRTEDVAKGDGGRLLNRAPSPARDAPVRTADAERADVAAWLRERLCEYTAVLVEEGKHIGAAARRAGDAK